MKTKILIVISALALGTACRSLSGLKKSYQYAPSNVTWNGRSANKLIENRFPVYGVATVIDGIATSNGGCVKRQFSMDVVTENEKSKLYSTAQGTDFADRSGQHGTRFNRGKKREEDPKRVSYYKQASKPLSKLSEKSASGTA